MCFSYILFFAIHHSHGSRLTGPPTAADLEEETGGKWRAGDKAKSARAFLRAIDIYNKGLEKFPNDADLAYNKYRLPILNIGRH